MTFDTKKRAVALGLTIGVIAGLVIGGLLVGSTSTADDALDRVCYQELGPEWSYQVGSAQYWNQTLNAKCVKNQYQDTNQTQQIHLGVKQ